MDQFHHCSLWHVYRICGITRGAGPWLFCHMSQPEMWLHYQQKLVWPLAFNLWHRRIQSYTLVPLVCFCLFVAIVGCCFSQVNLKTVSRSSGLYIPPPPAQNHQQSRWVVNRTDYHQHCLTMKKHVYLSIILWFSRESSWFRAKCFCCFHWCELIYLWIVNTCRPPVTGLQLENWKTNHYPL